MVASEPESNANLIIFGLYVDYQGTPGMDRVVTCLLSFLEKSLKDNGKSGMFIKALKRKGVLSTMKGELHQQPFISEPCCYTVCLNTHCPYLF